MVLRPQSGPPFGLRDGGTLYLAVPSGGRSVSIVCPGRSPGSPFRVRCGGTNVRSYI